MNLRPAFAVIVVVATSLFVGACGGNSHKTNQHIAAPAPDAVKFSQCMRRHGLSNFPDVIPDRGLPVQQEPNGSVAIVINGVPQPVSGPAFHKALSGCARYARSFVGNAVSGDAVNGVHSAMVRTAACMRKHGVPNYPDPPALGTVKVGHMSPTGRARSAGINVDAPAFKAALAKCGSIMNNALNG